MTATELCYLTIREASSRLQSGQLSPVDLTRAFLDRIEQLDGTLGALSVQLSAEQVDRLDAASAIPLGVPHEMIAERFPRYTDDDAQDLRWPPVI